MGQAADPLFLGVEEVLQIHAEQMALYTPGSGTTAVIKPGELESAVMAPRFLWQYSDEADIYDLAARYCSHLAQNHPFQDGNKRTALAAALQFLYLNGLDLSQRKNSPEVYQVTDKNLADMVVECIEKTFSEEQMADVLFATIGPHFFFNRFDARLKIHRSQNEPPQFQSESEARAWNTDLAISLLGMVCIELCQEFCIHPKRLNKLIEAASVAAVARVSEEFHAPFGMTITPD